MHWENVLLGHNYAKCVNLLKCCSGRAVSSQKFGKAVVFYFMIPCFLTEWCRLVPAFLNEWCTLRRMCPYLEFFWYVCCSIWIEYEDLPSKYPYSFQITEKLDLKNWKYAVRAKDFLMECIQQLKEKELIHFISQTIIAKQ